MRTHVVLKVVNVLTRVCLAGKEGKEGGEGRQQALRTAPEPFARHHRSLWQAEDLSAADERPGNHMLCRGLLSAHALRLVWWAMLPLRHLHDCNNHLHIVDHGLPGPPT